MVCKTFGNPSWSSQTDRRKHVGEQRPAQRAPTDHVTTWKPDLCLIVTQTHMVGHVCQSTLGI